MVSSVTLVADLMVVRLADTLLQLSPILESAAQVGLAHTFDLLSSSHIDPQLFHRDLIGKSGDR